MKKLLTIFALLCVSVAGFAIDWSGYNWLGNGGVDGKYTNKIKAVSTPELPGGASGFINNLQTNGGHASIHIAMPSAEFGAISLDAADYHTEGAGFFPHLDAFKKQETEFTVVCSGTTYTFTVYYADGEPEDLTGWNIAKGKTTASGYDANNERTHVAANDGDKNSRWSSEGGIHYPASGAQDWWYVDLGDFYSVETIKILFEGAFPNDYDLMVSNNAVSWTIIGTYTTNPKVGNTNADYNEYDFSASPYICRYIKIFARNGANINWGISIWEFEVYGDHASIDDHNPPTMTSASLSGDPSYDQVTIAVAGTDPEDGVVTQFHVVDATHGVDQSQTAEAGVITVTGLNAETSYTFTITALDAAGNESANSVNVSATTTQDTSIPLVAAPVPSGTGKEIRPIYCDAFASILEHSFDKDGFAGMPVYMEKNISGDNCLIYDRSGSAPVFTTWGMYDDGANAIIAQSEYRGSGMGVDASAMEYLHIDIWSLQACNTILIRINDGGRTGDLRLSHDGSGWKSFDIPLSEFEAGANVDNVRWFKFEAFDAITGKVALDNVYFWKTATGLHAVSATANNASFGTASIVVTESGLAPEGGMVADGTEVTFSATPNDGYIFVNWSNGNTNATFNATVDAAMNLTANFRALGTTYCNTLLHSSNGGQEHDAYVTMKRSGENEYQLIVRTTEALSNFGGTNFYKPNNVHVIDIRNQGVLSNNNHTLTVTFSCDKEPYMTSPLYVVLQGGFEAQFPQLTNIEYTQVCVDPEVTAIALNKTEATLDMGNTLTLVPTFTPAYMSADITWQTSDADVATVSNGVVTPVAAGNVIITAKVTEDVKATCSVTVQASTSHNWYGYGTDHDLDYTYRIEYTTDHHIVAHVKRQGDKPGLVGASMNINGSWTGINVTDGEEEGWKKGTTAQTYSAGDELTILIQSNFANGSSQVYIAYTVGSDNVMPTIEPSVVKLSNSSISMSLTDADLQLTAEIHHRDAANQSLTWTSDNEDIVTVVGGLVHPVGVGTTTVRATTFNDVEATCTVTIVGVLEAATWYGTGKFHIQGNPVAFNYSITRTIDHKLIYQTHLSEPIEGIAMKINHNDNWYTMSQDEGKRNATYTNDGPFVDGDAHNFYFRAEFVNGADNCNISYTVGAENSEPNTLLALDDALDNSDKISIHANDLMDVEFNRTFVTANEWYTICLPFDLTNEQLIEVFGAGYQLAEMTGSEDRGSLIHLNFDYVSALTAGKAYMLKPTTAVATAPTFEGVTIKSVTPIVSGDAVMHFVGTYDLITLNADNQRFVGPNNYLYSPAAGGTNMGAFRCYFEIPAGSPAPVRAARIVLADQVATDIDALDVKPNANVEKYLHNGALYILRDGRTYNAQGMLVK